MPSLRQSLKNRLRDAARVAVLAVGSEWRGDDAAGMLAGRNVEKRRRASGCRWKRKVKVFLGETAPENLTGAIRAWQPTHLVVLDAADMGKRGGRVEVFGPHDMEGLSCSTHQLPLSVMIDYMLKDQAFEAMVVGIQPRQMNYGRKVSPGVARAAEKTGAMLAEVFEGVLG
ncbi:MAG: hydrogenase maturation protease [Verrucomicrobiae bacterium]|nr:hydrogenase maturation protease [Verrucomicrobiae bacterium]